jgi:hypothetical protein
MKNIRLFIIIPMLALLASAGFAQYVDDLPLSYTLIGTNSGSFSYVMRGEIAAVRVTGTSGGTCDVEVTGGNVGSIFSKAAISVPDTYFPKIAAHGITGSAITFTTSVTSGAATANSWYTGIPVGGVVTVRVAGAVATTVTNTYGVTILYKK